MQLTYLQGNSKRTCMALNAHLRRLHSPLNVRSLHVPHLADLPRVRLQVHVLLQKQNVVDLVLAPDAVAAVRIVDARQIVKVLRPNLAGWNAQLEVQPSLGGAPNSDRVQFVLFTVDVVQRMAAAGVRVAIGKGDLRGVLTHGITLK